MANDMQRCPIWRTPVTQTIRYPGRDNLLAVQGSPRTDGNYEITTEASSYVGSLDESQKVKVTTRIIEERRKTGQTPLVTPKLIEDAKRADPLPVHERAERLLRYLVNRPHQVGEQFELLHPPPRNLEVLAWSESTSWDEIYFFTSYLTTRGWLNKEKQHSHVYVITVDGYEHVAEQARLKDSSQCFVAMWFNPKMNDAYEKGIKKAVEECGYTPLPINKKPDVIKIDDEIIAEIRRSRFVVADFTHDPEQGVRGGVYFEAGFASGLGLPVIYSCRETLKEALHFDTRQYYHILWKTEEDLCDELKKRILAIVGEGPKA